MMEYVILKDAKSVTELDGVAPSEPCLAMPQKTYENDMQYAYLSGKRSGMGSGFLYGMAAGMVGALLIILVSELQEKREKERKMKDIIIDED